jgi:transposase
MVFYFPDDAMNIKYFVSLTVEERQYLDNITSKGKLSARVIKRAHILLMSDQRQHEDKLIADSLSVSTSTVYRTKRNFVEHGLDTALEESSRPGMARKLDANQEALLVSLACSEPPAGSCRWTLTLLTDKLITLTEIEPVSTETIRRRLQENDLKPWQKKMWCIGSMNAKYIAQMEHILDLYAEQSDDLYPVVNFDEAGKQLVGQVKEPIATKPTAVAKEDYEYKREGMANIYVFFDRHRGWRKTKVTENKKAVDL